MVLGVDYFIDEDIDGIEKEFVVYERFTSKIYYNDEYIALENYTVEEGSTIITFNKEYTKKLGVCDYDLTIAFEDGSFTYIEFKIVMENPKMLSNYSDFIILISLFTILLFVVSLTNKKKLSK